MGRFDRKAIPMFSPHILIEDSTETIMESPHARYEFRGRAHSVIQAAIPLIDGRLSLDEIEGLTGTPVTSLCEVLDPFLEYDLVDISPLLNSQTSDDFMAAYFRLCDEWARYIFDSAFWQQMLDGQASREQVLGWGIEFYHRTLGADEHNRVSVDRCNSDAQVKSWLVEHFREELGHGEMFLRGLVACGFDPDDILCSTPLPSTRALIEYFNGLASTDTIAYLGCYGVLHSPRVGQTVDRVQSQFQRLTSCYPFARGILDAIRDHAVLDLELEHDQIVLERFAAREQRISPDIRSRILRAAKGTVVAFSGYFDGMHAYYGKTGAVLIRRHDSSENVSAGLNG